MAGTNICHFSCSRHLFWSNNYRCKTSFVVIDGTFQVTLLHLAVWFEEEVLFGDRELRNAVSKSNILARLSYMASAGNRQILLLLPLENTAFQWCVINSPTNGQTPVYQVTVHTQLHVGIIHSS